MLEGIDWTQIATVPAIIAMVNYAKQLGLNGKLSLLLAVFLGVFINLSIYWWGDQGWFAVAAAGLLTGLGAAGIWDVVVPASSARTLARHAALEPYANPNADEQEG